MQKYETKNELRAQSFGDKKYTKNTRNLRPLLIRNKSVY